MTLNVAPYVPSPLYVVHRMLQVAKAHRDDIVYDLGCGDSRILLTAIHDFNVQKAIGYELRTDLYNDALSTINHEGLEERIHVFNDDLFQANIAEATVITLYLTSYGNQTLRSTLLRDANDGTRIVSHDFDTRARVL